MASQTAALLLSLTLAAPSAFALSADPMAPRANAPALDISGSLSPSAFASAPTGTSLPLAPRDEIRPILIFYGALSMAFTNAVAASLASIV